MDEIQCILDVTFPFVESLLKEYGEFFPLASAMNINGNVEQVLLSEDEDNDSPKSTSVIGELKKELRWKRKDLTSIAIFYDVKIKEIQTDAIAIFVENKAEKLAYTFYFPYKMINNNPIFSEAWKEIAEMEIFSN